MKRLFAMALVAMVTLSLVACMGPGGGDKVRVKCPACGYEFDAPTE